jgi:hypothetical protein
MGKFTTFPHNHPKNPEIIHESQEKSAIMVKKMSPCEQGSTRQLKIEN